MANPEHLDWLLEGPERWNKIREEHDFKPALEGVDVYKSCMQKGLVDETGRVSLRGINLDLANLRHATLTGQNEASKIDFTDATFRRANLQNANLAHSCLDGVDFDGANLTGAQFYYASMRNVDMFKARFSGTDFYGADLTEADFLVTNLNDTNFSEAVLKGANLAQNDLKNTDLNGSRPWEAVLFEEGHFSSKCCVGARFESQVSSVSSLLEKCQALRALHADAELFFRGERDCNWELRPSVMRPADDGNFWSRANESGMLLELMARRPEDFQNTQSALAEWVVSQHHGLKTRLLDITRNPLVAMFWACLSDKAPQAGRIHAFSIPRELVKPFNSNVISVIANLAKLPREHQNALLGWGYSDVREREVFSDIWPHTDWSRKSLFHLIRKEKPYFEERIDPRDYYRVFAVEPEQSLERLRAQAGAFLISAFHERFERSEILKANPNIPVYCHNTWTVPFENKEDILKELSLLNVTRESLLPSLDEAARAVNARFRFKVPLVDNPF